MGPSQLTDLVDSLLLRSSFYSVLTLVSRFFIHFVVISPFIKLDKGLRTIRLFIDASDDIHVANA